MRIKKHIAVLRWAAILLSALWYLPSQAQTTDSLSHYLETAARYNPSVNSSFALYKASLEKIPQAGAFSDPELEMGFFFKPMEQLSGKQVADFTLMQMFPWFGTRQRQPATKRPRWHAWLTNNSGKPQQPVLRSQKPVVSIEQSE